METRKIAKNDSKLLLFACIAVCIRLYECKDLTIGWLDCLQCSHWVLTELSPFIALLAALHFPSLILYFVSMRVWCTLVVVRFKCCLWIFCLSSVKHCHLYYLYLILACTELAFTGVACTEMAYWMSECQTELYFCKSLVFSLVKW